MELDTQLNASDRSTRETISDNFRKIQAAYNDIQNQIDTVNGRLDRLDAEKATHDEMYQIRDNWNDRASHIALGTDVETTKAVVEQILQEKGLI
ncbi:hypothetical protein [Lactobacillus delbrueckii]|uniref:hypothetical protein n=1 Tax=Lactobacillus delbrueckii TaxID=1584 RepID=UPI001E440163|nr:hypothetical protein [Lactobacillus delbrueckii]MCD5446176.1 hypothetical protein [Lactobacillus delbrueckii subsp. lactis]MCZ0776431.1 hypothetical protein [Lactobacillus delbrueckii subsp. sunkii]MCZ0793548.1 hypothetical protein [Lactobacillus delbrueckii]